MKIMENQSTLQTIHPDSTSLKRYMQILIGQQISIFGSFIVQFVIIWWITITYKRAIYLALASFLGYGSTLLTSLLIGVYVDRYNRKKLIMISDSFQAVLSLFLIYLFATNNSQIVAILIVLTIRGVLQGIQQPAIWAIVPMMVPQDRLTRVNSIEYLFSGIVTMIGPLGAALLLNVFGLDKIALILLIDVITYGISFIPLVIAHIPTIKYEIQSSYWSDFKIGTTFIKETKGLFTLMMIFPFANFFLLPIIALLPLLIIEPTIFHSDQNTLAAALAVQQVAFILGSAMMSSRQWFGKNTQGIATGLIFWISGSLIIVLGGFWQNISLLYIGMFVSGFTIPVTNVSSQTIWQTVVPIDLQGRVTVVRRFFGEGSAPVAFILAGIFAELIGPLEVVLVGCIAETIILFYIYQFTNFRHVEAILSQNATKSNTTSVI